MAFRREKPELEARSPGFSHSTAHDVSFVKSHSACLALSWLEIKPLASSLHPWVIIRIVREQRRQSALKKVLE